MERRDRWKQHLKHYLDSGTALSASISKMTRSDLESALRELTHPDSDARQRVDDLLEEVRARSRRGAEQLSDLLRNELQREFEMLSKRRNEDLADIVDRAVHLFGTVIGHSTPASPSDAPPAASAAPPRRGPRSSPATKTSSPATKQSAATEQDVPPTSPAKKAAATASPAKRAAVKKTPAVKKAVAKKTPATTKAATKKVSAKQVSAEKASAKKVPAKRAAKATTGSTKVVAKRVPAKRSTARRATESS
jgi:hypothetical protein